MHAEIFIDISKKDQFSPELFQNQHQLINLHARPFNTQNNTSTPENRSSVMLFSCFCYVFFCHLFMYSIYVILVFSLRSVFMTSVITFATV